MSLLTGAAISPPAFPLQILGPFWGEWCETVADGATAPNDYVGAALLTVAGALIGNARVATAGSWSEPPVLWTVLVGKPSSNKSPAMDPFMDLLASFQLTLDSEAGERIVIDDASAAGIAPIAQASPKGLLEVRDELSGWWSTFASLGGEQFWLKAFGARPHTVIRKERQLHVPRLAISVLGGAQPDTIRAVVQSKSNKGLAARLLYIAPQPTPGFRLSEEVNHALSEASLERLFALPATGKPLSCALEPRAAALLTGWVSEKRAVVAESEGVWSEWLGKQPGIAMRIALILEHLWWAAEAPMDTPPPDTITERAYRAAIEFIDDYAAPMAANVLDVASRSRADNAATLLARWLVKSGRTQFNARLLRRDAGGPGGDLRDAAVMNAACEDLVAARIIRDSGKRTGTTAGRRSADYEVNPALFSNSLVGGR